MTMLSGHSVRFDLLPSHVAEALARFVRATLRSMGERQEAERLLGEPEGGR